MSAATRLLIHTGPGGSAVTTLTAMTAVAAASAGQRTLALALADGESLAATLGCAPSGEPVPVADHLWCATDSAVSDDSAGLSAVLRWLRELARRARIDDSSFQAIAGSSVAMGLYAVRTLAAQARSGRWEVITVDPPPWQMTMELLTTLAPMAEGLSTTIPAANRRNSGGLLRVLADVPTPDAATLDELAALGADAAWLYGRLGDETLTSFRITDPRTARGNRVLHRLQPALALHQYPCDAVIDVSALAPATTRLRASSGPAAVTLPAWDHAPVGFADLVKLAEATFGGRPPWLPTGSATAWRILRRDGGALLVLPLPGIRERDLKVQQVSERIDLRVGHVTRVLRLPPDLHGMSCRSARYDGAELTLTFETPPAGSIFGT